VLSSEVCDLRGNRLRRLPVLCGILIIFAVCPGCGQSRQLPVRPGMVIAEGYVTLDGAPLDAGQVTMIAETASNADDEDQWRIVTILNGKFEIEIAPGRYAVRIQKYEYFKNKDAKPLLPEKYDRKTTLSAEITERGPNRLSFQLESESG